MASTPRRFGALLTDAFEERLELARARGVAELAERLGFNLSYALARDGEVLADLFERVLAAVLAEAEAHLDDLLLARGERGQDLVGYLAQVRGDDRVGRVEDGLVLDEVPEVRVLLLADGRLQRDGLLRDLQDLAHLRDRDVHLARDLFARRLAAQLLDERARGANQLVDGLDHVDGDADGARLIGDGARDGLANPPRRVSRELIPAPPLELVDGLHQTDVPLLNEVEELEAAVGVLLGDGDDETEVGLDELALGLRGLGLADDDCLERALDLDGRDALVDFELLEPLAGVRDVAFEVALLVGADALLAELVGVARDLALGDANLFGDLADGIDQALARLFGEVEELDLLRDFEA